MLAISFASDVLAKSQLQLHIKFYSETNLTFLGQ